MLKKIAITQRLVQNESYFEQREALDVRWGKLFKEVNLLPIVLPIEYDFESYFKTIGIDGIFLTGGNDLSIFSKNEDSIKRDVFEIRLIEYSIKNNIPIFGVCRGMQMIAHYFNAKFIKVENQVGIRHKLYVNKNSKYFEYLTKIQNVNSFHNYAVSKICEDFIVSAKDEHKVIKAIEHKKYKIFAQMWHTEREDNFNQGQLDLIKGFFR